MRIYYLVILICGLLLCCSRNSGSGSSEKLSDRIIGKQIIPVAEKYIMSQVSDAKKEILHSGAVIISNDQKRYIIEPSMIYTGHIDDDQKTDAIVSLSVFQGQYQIVSEQLVILSTGKDFMPARAIESDMRIISVKDGIITADVPEHSRNSPLFNCSSCWEVVKYHFRLGELVKIE
jgi:hypothetical protein